MERRGEGEKERRRKGVARSRRRAKAVDFEVGRKGEMVPRLIYMCIVPGFAMGCTSHRRLQVTHSHNSMMCRERHPCRRVTGPNDWKLAGAARARMMWRSRYRKSRLHRVTSTDCTFPSLLTPVCLPSEPNTMAPTKERHARQLRVALPSRGWRFASI